MLGIDCITLRTKCTNLQRCLPAVFAAVLDVLKTGNMSIGHTL